MLYGRSTHTPFVPLLGLTRKKLLVAIAIIAKGEVAQAIAETQRREARQQSLRWLLVGCIWQWVTVKLAPQSCAALRSTYARNTE